jgi:hypothetical protein
VKTIEQIAQSDLEVIDRVSVAGVINQGLALAGALERRAPSQARGVELRSIVSDFRAACHAIAENYVEGCDFTERAITPEEIVAIRDPSSECARLAQEVRAAAAQLIERLDAGATVDRELAERMQWRRSEHAPRGYGALIGVLGSEDLERLRAASSALAGACAQLRGTTSRTGGAERSSPGLETLVRSFLVAHEHFSANRPDAEDYASPEAWVAAEHGESAMFAMRAELAEIKDALRALAERADRRGDCDPGDSGPSMS